MRDAVSARFAALPSPSPDRVGAALLKIVGADKPPLRVFFGTLPHYVVPQVYAERFETWEAWAEVAAETSHA